MHVRKVATFYFAAQNDESVARAMCYHSHAKTKNAKRDTRKYPRPISMQSEHNARADQEMGLGSQAKKPV